MCCILQAFTLNPNKKIAYFIVRRKPISKFEHTDVIMERMFNNIGVLTCDFSTIMFRKSEKREGVKSEFC